MITLERLQVFDIEQTIDLAERFNKLYGIIDTLSRNKIRRTLEASLLYDKVYFALVMKEDTKVVGAFVGIAVEHPYYDSVFASELGWYVEEQYRGIKSLDMLYAFEAWAKTEAKANFLSMAYTTKMSDLDKLYTNLGYERVELTYKKEIG